MGIVLCTNQIGCRGLSSAFFTSGPGVIGVMDRRFAGISSITVLSKVNGFSFVRCSSVGQGPGLVKILELAFAQLALFEIIGRWPVWKVWLLWEGSG